MNIIIIINGRNTVFATSMKKQKTNIKEFFCLSLKMLSHVLGCCGREKRSKEK